MPGVWELEVEARRTSPSLNNPYRLTARVQGVTVDPATVTLPTAAIGTSTPVTWSARNDFGPVPVRAEGGPLGSASSRRPSIAQGEVQVFEVVVPAGAARLDVGIGDPDDAAADLDLYLTKDGVLLALAADGDSEEAVSLADPAPGTYQVQIDGYAVPAGETGYDYLDVFLASALGRLHVPATVTNLPAGGSLPITGSVVADSPVAEGRRLFGEMTVVTDRDAVIGRGTVEIAEVLEPSE
jgi:hypothetical protein